MLRNGASLNIINDDARIAIKEVNIGKYAKLESEKSKLIIPSLKVTAGYINNYSAKDATFIMAPKAHSYASDILSLGNKDCSIENLIIIDNCFNKQYSEVEVVNAIGRDLGCSRIIIKAGVDSKETFYKIKEGKKVEINYDVEREFELDDRAIDKRVLSQNPEMKANLFTFSSYKEVIKPSKGKVF